MGSFSHSPGFKVDAGLDTEMVLEAAEGVSDGSSVGVVLCTSVDSCWTTTREFSVAVGAIRRVGVFGFASMIVFVGANSTVEKDSTSWLSGTLLLLQLAKNIESKRRKGNFLVFIVC